MIAPVAVPVTLVDAMPIILYLVDHASQIVLLIVLHARPPILVIPVIATIGKMELLVQVIL